MAADAADPLPSWREGPAKNSILAFAASASNPESPCFWPEEERVAVFDNDGTLWVEQPMYTQLAFALDRLKALAPSHPEWAASPGLSAALAGDLKGLMAGGIPALLELAAVTHGGVTSDEFAAAVAEWIKEARHPQFGRLYTECVYQPMLEVMELLRASGFQVWIVSGGGVEFMRPWAPATYGVPTERILGSTVKTEYRVLEDGTPTILRKPEVAFINDGPGKPVAISSRIGRRPIAAFGNSDGDFEMLQWTSRAWKDADLAPVKGRPGRRRTFSLLVHHTDAEREYAYDKTSAAGRLDKALDAAGPSGWVVVDTKRDWARVFAWEEEGGAGEGASAGAAAGGQA